MSQLRRRPSEPLLPGAVDSQVPSVPPSAAAAVIAPRGRTRFARARLVPPTTISAVSTDETAAWQTRRRLHRRRRRCALRRLVRRYGARRALPIFRPHGPVASTSEAANHLATSPTFRPHSRESPRSSSFVCALIPHVHEHPRYVYVCSLWGPMVQCA